MKRRLLNLLTALSLLVCVAVVALWVRSYSRAQECNAVVPGVAAYVNASKGEIAAGVYSTSRDQFAVQCYERRPYHMRRAGTVSYRPVIDTDAICVLSHREAGYWITAVQLPASLVAAAFLAPALLAAAVRARRAWHVRSSGRHGICASCGYDLRATPGRCPECGAAAAREGIT